MDIVYGIFRLRERTGVILFVSEESDQYLSGEDGKKRRSQKPFHGRRSRQLLQGKYISRIIPRHPAGCQEIDIDHAKIPRGSHLDDNKTKDQDKQAAIIK